MSAQPDPQAVRQAAELFLKVAYPASVPAKAKAALAVIASYDDPLCCPAFVRETDGNVVKYNARLGNVAYPHMKLAIEFSPDQSRYFFRADTHDRHICPKTDSREYGAFCALMKHNAAIAEQIEQAWHAAGLPTFKAYLRDDLQRRIDGQITRSK